MILEPLEKGFSVILYYLYTSICVVLSASQVYAYLSRTILYELSWENLTEFLVLYLSAC